MFENLSIFILIILLFTAGFFDAKEKRIPNFITLPVILAGLILNIIMNSLNGVMFSFYGVLIGLCVFFIPFAFGLMGAGDVKLMAAIGALMGWKFTLLSSLFSAVAGIIVVFVYLICKKRLFTYFGKYFVVLVRVILKYTYLSEKNIVCKKLMKFACCNEFKNENNEKLYVPYGLAIALGTLFVMFGSLKGYMLF